MKKMIKKCFGIIECICNKKLKVKTIGKGTIWVSNKNGDLTNGDYITSSNIPGYGYETIIICSKKSYSGKNNL